VIDLKHSGIDLIHFGVDAEAVITAILNREILKEISKEHFKDSTYNVDDAIASNVRAYQICMDGSDLEGASEALSRIIQLMARKIKNRHCE